MKAPLFLLPLLLLAAPSSAREKDPWVEPWAGARYTGDDIKASRELMAIQERIDRRELPKIQFDFDSDALRMNSSPTLDAIVDILLADPKIKVMVLAHTCTIGTEAYNLDLSRRRARSVKEYLVKHGVPPPSIRYYGMGYAVPIADNSTVEGREKNRRVEFRVTFRDWPSVW